MNWNTDSEQGRQAPLTLDLWWHLVRTLLGLQAFTLEHSVQSCSGGLGTWCGLHDGSLRGLNTGCTGLSMPEVIFLFL